MEEILIDTNVLVNFFLKTELTKTAKELIKLSLTKYKPTIFVNIFEETVFILIREELKAKGIEKFYDQKDFIAKNDYKDIILYKKFFEFLKIFNIDIKQNSFNIDDFINIMENYMLFPNDALIAATCKYYRIKKIATFDEDFKRVDFLEIVDPSQL